MFEPFAHKHEPAIDPITVDGMIRLAGDAPKFGFGFGRHDLIGVEDEDPFVFEGQILQSPVFLFWPDAIEMKLHHLRTVCFGDAGRPIGALRIQDKDFVRPRDGL